LKSRGYKVTENAMVKGRSGAEHRIDMLATRDDGIITYNIAIGIEVAGDEIGLGEIFDFDDKAYDSGIHDKILVVVPALRREAEKFASQQRIKVLEVRDLETVLTSSLPPSTELKRASFKFESKSKLIKYLKQSGYDIKEDDNLKGRSGAEHKIDILATKDDGIVTHHIAIGIEVATEPIELDKVFDFDDKAYDIGILDKAFIAVPGLTPEAQQFAKRQRIKVFETKALELPS
jgi:general secretion pathway protein E